MVRGLAGQLQEHSYNMTVEEKIRMLIGNLMVENIALATKVDELTRKIAELERAESTE